METQALKDIPVRFLFCFNCFCPLNQGKGTLLGSGAYFLPAFHFHLFILKNDFLRMEYGKREKVQLLSSASMHHLDFKLVGHQRALQGYIIAPSPFHPACLQMDRQAKVNSTFQLTTPQGLCHRDAVCYVRMLPGGGVSPLSHPNESICVLIFQTMLS